MINNQELRVGNYILVDRILRKVCCIKNDDGFDQTPCIGFEQNSSCHYEMTASERVKPAPISDQVLKDFGFVFHDYFRLWQHARPDRTYCIELDVEYSALDFSHRPIVRNITCLHQLQNLFFYIQGQELIMTDSNVGPDPMYSRSVLRAAD